MQYWHVTIASRGRRTLFPTESRLRAAVRATARVLGAHLALFCVVDDHIHLVVVAQRDRAILLARSLNLALAPMAQSISLGSAYLKRIDSRRHLEGLIAYVALNPHKHRVAAPALWSGSCFQDLVGARVINGFSPSIIALELPRFRMQTLYRAAGLPDQPLRPPTPDVLRRLGADRIAAASLSAVAAPPDGSGKTRPVVAARRSTVAITDTAGVPSAQVAVALGLSHRAISHLRHHPPPPSVRNAALLRLALEEALMEHRPKNIQSHSSMPRAVDRGRACPSAYDGQDARRPPSWANEGA